MVFDCFLAAYIFFTAVLVITANTSSSSQYPYSAAFLYLIVGVLNAIASVFYFSLGAIVGAIFLLATIVCVKNLVGIFQKASITRED